MQTVTIKRNMIIRHIAFAVILAAALVIVMIAHGAKPQTQEVKLYFVDAEMMRLIPVSTTIPKTNTRKMAQYVVDELIEVSFPAYDNPSSTLVKMYLDGDFGEKPSDVNAYATSTFFAADRFATYRTDWGKDYNSGTIILADRYVSSNLIHQASKIDNSAEKDKFLTWLDDLEHNMLSVHSNHEEFRQ